MRPLDTIIRYRVVRLLLLSARGKLTFAQAQRLIRHVRAEVLP